ncbi:MAG: 3-hydroxybutyryl-CoA dehydrogenase [Hydrogenibacillus schlegelii]|uniref:3-hydroxybutyryl-CoA dehydrogenase n=2 Tax=Hydrogenibacillus schlegelii TaxID=1484 RepID=A0A2T5G819_HYDSH|nr:MAG: 3-hydroxybutyryl-CoA dehydrogenase [Hydrogenibacillus schlegelii]
MMTVDRVWLVGEGVLKAFWLDVLGRRGIAVEDGTAAVDGRPARSRPRRGVALRSPGAGEARLLSAPAFIIDVENVDLRAKRRRLRRLGARLHPHGLLLTSAHAVSATEAAAWFGRPDAVVGYGAFPAYGTAPAVDLAAPLGADPSGIARAEAWLASIGVRTFRVGDEVGLAFPRVLAMIINEAAFALMEGVATAEDIDRAMRLGTNYPEGPLAWADRIGLDEVQAVLRGLYRAFGEDRYRPAPIFRQLIAAGRLGRKAGHGFYAHTDEAKER